MSTVKPFTIYIGRIDKGGVWRDGVIVPPLGQEIRSHGDMTRIQLADAKRARKRGDDRLIFVRDLPYMDAPEREQAPAMVHLSAAAAAEKKQVALGTIDRTLEKRRRALLR